MADFPPEWCAYVGDVKRYLQVYGDMLDSELRARAELHLQRLLDEGTPDLVKPHQNLNFLDADTVQCVLEQLEAEFVAPFSPISEMNGLEDCFDRLTHDLEEDAIYNFHIAENQEGFGIPVPNQLDIPITNESAGSFEIVGRRKRYIKKFKTDFEEVQIRMKTMPDNASPVDWVKNIFDELVRLMLAGCATRNDMVSMEITSANSETRSVFVPMRRAS